MADEQAVVRRARKRWKCCNAHAASAGNAPDCRRYIEAGEQYVEGDIDPYLAGGFGRDKLCLGCSPQ